MMNTQKYFSPESAQHLTVGWINIGNKYVSTGLSRLEVDEIKRGT